MEMEDLQNQHADLSDKIDENEKSNVSAHDSLHSKMNSNFKWVLGILVTLFSASFYGLWSLRDSITVWRSEQKQWQEEERARQTETDTTQTSVLGRVDKLEVKIDKHVERHNG